MAIDFPNSPPPESGDVYTGPNGVSYTFDGIKWIGQETSGGSGTSGSSDRLVNGSYTFILGGDGVITLPPGGDIRSSTGTSVLGTPTALDGGTASTTF
jgi:hypothetical protein